MNVRNQNNANPINIGLGTQPKGDILNQTATHSLNVSERATKRKTNDQSALSTEAKIPRIMLNPDDVYTNDTLLTKYLKINCEEFKFYLIIFINNLTADQFESRDEAEHYLFFFMCLNIANFGRESLKEVFMPSAILDLFVTNQVPQCYKDSYSIVQSIFFKNSYMEDTTPQCIQDLFTQYPELENDYNYLKREYQLSEITVFFIDLYKEIDSLCKERMAIVSNTGSYNYFLQLSGDNQSKLMEFVNGSNSFTESKYCDKDNNINWPKFWKIQS